MHFSTIFATSLALLSTASAAPTATKYGFQVHYKSGTGKYDGNYLGFGTYNNNTQIAAFANGSSQKSGATSWTVSKGSVHVKIPPNMVISSGQYSTNTVAYGDFVVFSKGKGSNDYFEISKGQLSFKPLQGNQCTNNCWELCPVGDIVALSLGNTQAKGCIPVKVSAVKL